ncbi:ABC transporter substrate-binding protein [Brevibacterium moorei]|uniref:ABC transporter substrate-binding protein n=1 Tax=Brevibacterium moorei TaxID=2968457 RepID=UPI00211C9487|nr:ABC transporter substrate-binding protein [Brevibacterium sp. 68QC2CO]MCQ9386831.1 ABC transporter substrate-binding protein [Brevibacterium sp. 68QC2CO]
MRAITKAGTMTATLAVTALLVSACGGGGEGTDTAETGDALAPVPTETFDVQKDEKLAAQLPDSIKKAGAINIAGAAGSAPDVFVDEKGELVGWEIDLVKAAADKFGVKPKFNEISFDSVIPGLQADRYDIAFGQIGITNERMKKIDQVGTALGNQGIAATSDSDIKVESLNDLCGKKVATTRGSRQQEFGDTQSKKCVDDGNPAVEMQVYDDGTKANMAMLSGRADVSWSGSTGMNYFVANSQGKAKIVGHYLEPYPMGGALPKGSDFSKPFAASINSLIADGTYAKIMDKWGLADNEINKVEVNPTVKDQ